MKRLVEWLRSVGVLPARCWRCNRRVIKKVRYASDSSQTTAMAIELMDAGFYCAHCRHWWCGQCVATVSNCQLAIGPDQVKRGYLAGPCPQCRQEAQGAKIVSSKG
jgi:hypothetical protein